MNSFWNENLKLFEQRFPELASQLDKATCPDMVLMQAKNGMTVASHNGLMLHSKYDPKKEAENLIKQFDGEKSDTALFLGFGLGYAVIDFAEKYPDKTIMIAESRSDFFFTALENADWTPVFRHPKLIITAGADLAQAKEILSTLNATTLHVFRTKAQSAHDEEYFTSLEKAVLQNAEKEKVNTNTLEKFSHLWTSNSLRNLRTMEKFDGANKYLNLGREIPFTVIAAGPSLETLLPHLSEIKKRSMIVCVDTALHACLKAGVEPDFIILADPQYYCSLHLEFLRSPSSVLLAEIAAYPSVLRFQCREIVLFTSLFPIGQYFEKQCGTKGQLLAGGSVTTSAWDFARLCDSRRIYIAGMDLGFPGMQTHIRGSKFEEKIHAASCRTKNAETDNASCLISASPYFASDYDGNKILTDKKMALYSWWFETHCTKARDQGAETYSLTPQSQAIKGIERSSIEEFLKLPEIEELKKEFFARAQEMAAKYPRPDMTPLIEKFTSSILVLKQLAKKGLDITKKTEADRTRIEDSNYKLNQIDNQILKSEVKDAASLVFPTQRQLEKLVSQIPNQTEADKQLYSIRYSKIIYTQLLKSTEELEKFFPIFS